MDWRDNRHMRVCESDSLPISAGPSYLLVIALNILGGWMHRGHNIQLIAMTYTYTLWKFKTPRYLLSTNRYTVPLTSIMNNVPDIGFVDAHTKRHSGHYTLHREGQRLVLQSTQLLLITADEVNFRNWGNFRHSIQKTMSKYGTAIILTLSSPGQSV